MTKKTEGAVVLLSGGLDSTSLLAWAVARFGNDRVLALSIEYGQKHRKEVVAAAQIAEELEVEFQFVFIPPVIFQGGHSSLVDMSTEVEMIGTYEELAARYGAQPTVVPNRNMVFISLATAMAEARGYSHVLNAAHAGDAHNYHYPDCRPAFNGAMEAAIDLSTEGRVQLLAPFNHMTKGEVVSRGRTLGAPLHLSTSCYRGGEKACGQCGTCHERIQAFIEAGYIDPIEYEINLQWPESLVRWLV